MTDAREPPPLDGEVLSQMLRDLDQPIVLQLVEAFVTEMMDRVERLAAAAARRDGAAMQHEAHALKSSAATYGAAQVARLSTEIEAACRAGRADAALEVVQRLPDAGDRAAAAFADWQRRHG